MLCAHCRQPIAAGKIYVVPVNADIPTYPETRLHYYCADALNGDTYRADHKHQVEGLFAERGET